MAGRGRRSSTISVDEIERRGNKKKHIPEAEVLRPVGKQAHPDDYPCFVLEDATVFLQDGKTIANLLNAELQGPFVVRGRLVVDVTFNNRLFSKRLNGQYIDIARCESFSIGDGPLTLWALGKSGWFELQPSEAYRSTYSKMIEAISIFYLVTDLFEEEQRRKGSKSKNSPSIDKVLLKYAIHEGTGLIRSEAADKIKSHAQFLLSHMRKVQFDWQPTELFKWLSAECTDIYTRLLQKAGETVIPPIPIALTKLPTPEPQLAPLPEPPRTQAPKATKILPHHSRTSHPPHSHSTHSSILTCRTSGDITPSSNHLPESCDPLTAILSLLRASRLDIRGWSPMPRMTYSKLGTLFYYAYTLKSEPIAQELIRRNASTIISSLGTEWKASPLYAQLSEVASKPTPKSENRTLAMSITEVSRRGKVSNRSAAPAVGRSSRQDHEKDHAHGSKSTYPPHSGRRSGKEAGLRLASWPAAVKRLDRAESVEDDGSRPRKRRRPSPPEMGDVSDEDPSFPALASMEVENDSEDDGEDEEDDVHSAEVKPVFTLKMVTEALPSLAPLGPNRTWTCDREDCVFVVRDAESMEGKEKIMGHFSEHAKQLERQRLVRQEAAQRRLPIAHLLEKLRSIGEESRLEGRREIIGGRLVPEPIKRERGTAV